MNLFNRNVFGYPVFNTGEVAVPKTRLFNRNVFASPPLLGTGEVMGPVAPPLVVLGSVRVFRVDDLTRTFKR